MLIPGALVSTVARVVPESEHRNSLRFESASEGGRGVDGISVVYIGSTSGFTIPIR